LILKLLCMSLKGTKRHWICMRVCTMLSPSRPSSINVPMYAWSKQWKTGNRKTTERRGRRGVLHECGGSVAKNAEMCHIIESNDNQGYLSCKRLCAKWFEIWTEPIRPDRDRSQLLQDIVHYRKNKEKEGCKSE